MFSFSFGNKRFLGIDIGYSTLKAVELEARGENVFLSNYAWMAFSQKRKDGTADANFFKTILPEYLKKIIKEAGFKSRSAYISIPAFGALITLIDFPKMPEKDMEQAIRFEAKKYIPTSLDEVALTWEIVGEEFGASENKNGGEKGNVIKDKVKILLVAVSKNKVLAYEQAVKNAGLNLAGVEVENIAATTSLVGNDKGNFMVMDIGSRVCNLIYIEKGVIGANRNIDAGGDDLTKAIADGLGITKERAEMMKISGKNFFSPEFNINFSALNLIIGEISRILGNFSKNRDNFHLDALILSGGASNLAGLANFFQQKLSVKTITGNPFSRIKYDKKIESSLDGLKGGFSVAVGLALAGFEKKSDGQ